MEHRRQTGILNKYYYSNEEKAEERREVNCSRVWFTHFLCICDAMRISLFTSIHFDEVFGKKWIRGATLLMHANQAIKVECV